MYASSQPLQDEHGRTVLCRTNGRDKVTPLAVVQYLGHSYKGQKQQVTGNCGEAPILLP